MRLPRILVLIICCLAQGVSEADASVLLLEATQSGVATMSMFNDELRALLGGGGGEAELECVRGFVASLRSTLRSKLVPRDCLMAAAIVLVKLVVSTRILGRRAAPFPPFLIP